jgi:hypothetical protein
MPLIAGRTPDGGAESSALAAFKKAFASWLAGVPPDKWRENLRLQAGVQ